MRAVFLSFSYPRFPGDYTGVAVHRLAEALVGRGHSVTAICPRTELDQDLAVPEGLKIVRARLSSGLLPRLLSSPGALESANLEPAHILKSPWYAPAIYYHLVREAKTADLINAHWLFPAGLIASMAGSSAGKPVVTTLHSAGVHVLSNVPGHTAIGRYIAARTSKLLSTSYFVGAKAKAVFQGMVPLPEIHFAPVPSAVGAPLPMPPYEGQLNVLAAGRLVEQKGFHILLEALRGLDGISVTIAGEGPEMSRLVSMADRYGLPVRFWGRYDAGYYRDLLERHHLVAIPSLVVQGGKIEGRPLVAVDALLAGRPVIASDAGGMSEIVIPGENGFLFTAGSARELRERLMELSADPEPLFRRAENAPHALADHVWEKAAALYETALSDCLPGAS